MEDAFTNATGGSGIPGFLPWLILSAAAIFVAVKLYLWLF